MIKLLDYATLHLWLNRDKSVIHGEVLANIDNLIRTAIMYDDALICISHLETRQTDLMRSIRLLLQEIAELKAKQ